VGSTSRIEKSFHDLARLLARRAYWRATENNDLRHYEAEDRDLDELYGDYWEYRYRYALLSAFYDLAPAVREQLRAITSDAATTFYETASTFARRRPPRVKDRELVWFDGTKNRPLVMKSKRVLEGLIAKDRPRAKGGKSARLKSGVKSATAMTLRGIPGVGPGDPYKAALDALGPPQKLEEYDDILFPRWGTRGVSMGISKPAYIVEWLAVTVAKGWRTDRGIGRGSTRGAIVKAYGKPASTGAYVEDRRRITELAYGKTVLELTGGTLLRIHMNR